MARMNWEKTRQQDRIRRNGSERIYKPKQINLDKRATDKQISLIFKHQMLENIPINLTVTEASTVISAFAEANGWNSNAR